LSFRSAAEESASAVALLSVIPKQPALNELKWGDLLLLLPVLIRPIGANPG
jgi:hypothetical protein